MAHRRLWAALITFQRHAPSAWSTDARRSGGDLRGRKPGPIDTPGEVCVQGRLSWTDIGVGKLTAQTLVDGGFTPVISVWRQR